MAKAKVESVAVAPPNFQRATFQIIGVSPLVQNKFSAKAEQTMRDRQEAGSTGNKGKAKEAKDFEACFKGATYKSTQGWYGIPACTFRNAIISVCRVVGFKMTLAKLSVFVEADGFDETSQTPLVKITKGVPKMDVSPVRLPNGSCDLRARPMWAPGWEATLRVRFDADQFKLADITHLLMRVGLQNGIGEGRAFSKMSTGCGWGEFEIKAK
jgi:hypothetical protein